MNTPLVSVVIPCYNQARFLGAAIDSALRQSYSPVEVVVVNDGSTDDTAAVAQRYGSQIQYVAQSNKGLSGARNAGLAVANGFFVQFLDSDDLLEPTRVARGIELLDHSAADVVVCGWQRFGDGCSAPSVHVPPPGSRLVELLCQGGFPVHAALVRRSAIHEDLFDESLRSHEDLDLWWRLSLRGATVASDAHMGVHYRQHPASMSHNTLLMLATRAQVQLRYLDRLLNDRQWRSIAGPFLAHDLAVLRRQLVACRGTTELERALWTGLRKLRNCGFHPQRHPLTLPLYAMLGPRADDLIGLATVCFTTIK